jgi:thiol:disulfide interchange protein
MVVSHPVRRKIILYLIVAGKIGLTSAMATLIVPFVQRDEQSILQNAGFILILILSALAFGLFFQLPFSKKPLELLQRRLLEGAGNLRAVDYEVLLKVKHGFCVSDLEI